MNKFFHLTKKYQDILLSLLLAFLLSVVLTSPAIFNLNSKYIGDGFDNYEFASNMGLAAKNIGWGNFPFAANDFWRYPVGFDFSRAFDSYMTVSLGTVFVLIFGLPLGYNLTILLLLSINGLLSFLVFKALSGSRSLGILGMIIYGFSFYTLGKAASHPNLMFTGAISLFVLSFFNLIIHKHLTKRHFSLFLLSIIFIALGSSEFLILTAIFSVIYLLLILSIYKDATFKFLKRIFSHKEYVVSSFLILIFVLGIIYFPHIKALINHEEHFIDRSEELYLLTPKFIDFIYPNKYLNLLSNNFFSTDSLKSIERVVFFGWLEVVLFIIFFFTKYPRKFKLLMGLGFLIPFTLSFGYGKDNDFFLLPYNFLREIPPFSIIAQPGRLVVFAYFISTIAILLVLKKIKIHKWKGLFLLLIGLVLIFERTPKQFYLSQTYKNEAFIEDVRQQDSKAVLDLPLKLDYRPYNILSLLYEKPIVNGYFHFLADGEKEKSFIMNSYINRYQCEKDSFSPLPNLNLKEDNELDKLMIQKLKDQEITTLVIHKDDKFFFPECKNVRLRLSNLLPRIEPLGTSDVEKKLTLKTWDSKPSFTFYFPRDGVFYLNSAYISSSSPASFILAINGDPVDFSFSWAVQKDSFGQLLMPKDTISFNVNAGSYLTFYSQDQVGNTDLLLWYRYTSTTEALVKPLELPMNKIFEDEKQIVYTLQ